MFDFNYGMEGNPVKTCDPNCEMWAHYCSLDIQLMLHNMFSVYTWSKSCVQRKESCNSPSYYSYTYWQANVLNRCKIQEEDKKLARLKKNLKEA